MNLLIMGKPGAGKGTLASKLLDHYQLTHISTGNIYREEIAKRSPIGVEAEKFIVQGELVPDEMTNDIVKKVLHTGKFPHGFMLDGYPRTTAQAITHAAAEASSALAMNARRRPIRCMTSAAGIVERARPRMTQEIGSVARPGDGASWLPRMPPSSVIVIIPEADSACAAVST